MAFQSDDVLFAIDGCSAKFSNTVRIENAFKLLKYAQSNKFVTYLRSVNGFEPLIQHLCTQSTPVMRYVLAVLMFTVSKDESCLESLPESVIPIAFYLLLQIDVSWKEIVAFETKVDAKSLSQHVTQETEIDLLGPQMDLEANSVNAPIRSSKRKQIVRTTSVVEYNGAFRDVEALLKSFFEIPTVDITCSILASQILLLNSSKFDFSSCLIVKDESKYLKLMLSVLNEDFQFFKKESYEGLLYQISPNKSSYCRFTRFGSILSIFENLSRSNVAKRDILYNLVSRNLQLLQTMASIFTHFSSFSVHCNLFSSSIYSVLRTSMHSLVNFTHQRLLSIDMFTLVNTTLHLLIHSFPDFSHEDSFMNALKIKFKDFKLKTENSYASSLFTSDSFFYPSVLFNQLGYYLKQISSSGETAERNNRYDCVTLCLGLLINGAEVSIPVQKKIAEFMHPVSKSSFIKYLMDIFTENISFAEQMEAAGTEAILNCFEFWENQEKMKFIVCAEDLVLESRVLSSYVSILLSLCIKSSENEFLNNLKPHQLESFIKTIDDFTVFQYAANNLTPETLESLLVCSKYFRKIAFSLSKSHPGSIFFDKNLLSKSSLSALPSEFVATYLNSEQTDRPKLIKASSTVSSNNHAGSHESFDPFKSSPVVNSMSNSQLVRKESKISESPLKICPLNLSPRVVARAKSDIVSDKQIGEKNSNKRPADALLPVFDEIKTEATANFARKALYGKLARKSTI